MQYINAEKIKLVIWDLDNTIWDGVLAEKDDVKLYPYIAKMLYFLNLRGIMCSICSKNDYEEAKSKLEELGIWEWFVFPSIDFNAKGPRVKQIIEDMNLRAENVLFIDDITDNLSEVKFYSPDIHILIAMCIDDLLAQPALQGEVDEKFTRLHQYRDLEKKQNARKLVSDNVEFLRSIHVKVQMMAYTEQHFERIFDMVHRTNQLNFTKNRMEREELKALVEDPQVICGCVRVVDDFSDNGIIGFYAVKNGELVHFMFSCRIINMGIEQWVYTYLGEPELEVVGKVAGTVKKGVPLYDYITLMNNDLPKYQPEQLLTTYMDQNEKLNLFAIGACDLYRMIGNLVMPNVKLCYECNVFRGNYRSVNVGTEYIRSTFDMTEEEKAYCVKHFHSYKGDLVFNTKLLSETYDYCILTFHDEYACPIFVNKKDPNLRVLYYFESIYDDDGNIMEAQDAREWLFNEFNPPMSISSERFADNLRWMRENIPSDTRLLLVNACEIEEDVKEHLHENILRINKVIKEFTDNPENNAVLIDVNKFMKDRTSFTDYIFHWSVEVSYKVTLECLKQMAKKPHRNNVNLFPDVPVNNRKVVVYGQNKFSLMSYYALIANGYSIDGIYYNEPNEEEGILPIDLLRGKKDDYYVIITENDAVDSCVNTLKEYGYQEKDDYMIYQPADFITHWYEQV